MIVNLTPHAVNLVLADGTVRTFESSGVARAEQTVVEAGSIEGCRLVRTSFGAPVDLPAPQEGVFYLVSSILVSAARQSGRTVEDLLLPSDSVRDAQGRIIGCRAFALVD
jgi:hypothetical protein